MGTHIRQLPFSLRLIAIPTVILIYETSAHPLLELDINALPAAPSGAPFRMILIALLTSLMTFFRC